MNKLFKAFQNLNRCDLYVFFWCIYQMQEILYEPGPINQGIQVMIMGWAFYEAGVYMLPQRKLPIMLKATSSLMFMYFIYGSVFIIFGSDFYDAPSTYLKSFFNSFLPLFLFYKYSENGYLDEKRIRIYFIIFLCVVIPQYFHEQDKLLAALRKRGSNRTEDTNNTGYYFVSLLPALFFWYKNRIIQYVTLCIILLFVLMGMKRGAIAIAGLCTVWFLWNSIKNATNKKHKYQTIAFGLTMAVIAVGAVSYQLANSDYFQQRVKETQEGNSSHRDVLYSRVIDAVINDDSIIHLLIGRGAYSTIKVSTNFAHQDWLETACNNGFVGLTILTFYFCVFYKTARDAQNVIKPEYKMCMMMLFFISFAKTWFSMSLENLPIYVTMPTAYLTYHTYHNKNNILLNLKSAA